MDDNEEKNIGTLKELHEVVLKAVSRAKGLYGNKWRKANPMIIIYDEDDNEYKLIRVGQTSLMCETSFEIKKVESPDEPISGREQDNQGGEGEGG